MVANIGLCRLGLGMQCLYKCENEITAIQLVVCWAFMLREYLNTYVDEYRLVTVHTYGNFIVLHRWDYDPTSHSVILIQS